MTVQSPVICSAVFGAGPRSVGFWMNRMPSPGFGASKMPLSTSLNSSTELPWASSRRRKSLSLSRQPAISGMNGKQLGAVRIELDPLADPGGVVAERDRAGLLAVGVGELPASRHGPRRRGRRRLGHHLGRIRVSGVRGLRRQRRGASDQQEQGQARRDGSCGQIITPASAAASSSTARVSREPASTAACPPPRPAGCRPRAGPSSGRVETVAEPRCGNSTTLSIRR